MKRNIKFWQTAAFFFVSFLGTILHFLYDWFNNKFIALFSSVNESTWEHMKLLFYPMFMFAIIEYYIIGENYENFWYVKLKGVLLALTLVPVIFYTLRGIFGTTPDIINILIFFFAAAVGFIYETRLFKKDTSSNKNEKYAFIILCLITALFMVFTFITPQIPLFLDPINKTFGI